MKSNQFVIKIAIEQLAVGMYITDMDISWIDSPFVRHNRLIKSEKDIQKLRDAGVKYLLIDIKKGNKPNSDHPSEQNKKTLDKPKEDQNLSSPSSMNQELKVALSIRNKVRDVITDIHNQISNNNPVPIDDVTPLVDVTIESLSRNNQALMSLVHLTRTAEKIADHCFSTFCLVLNIAMERKLDKEQTVILGLAALLHDAGWARLPINLMGKRLAYTKTEKKLLAEHPQIGLNIVSEKNLSETCARIIREHHERLDGSGYPKGLTADQLHPLTMYLAVADHYDECVHQLQDRPGMLPNNALRELYIQAEKGIFDVDAVAAMISMLGIYPVTTAVKLNTGESGVVYEVNSKSQLLPTIIIYYDNKKRALQKPITINLSQQSDMDTKRTIESILDPNSAKDDPERKFHSEYDLV